MTLLDATTLAGTLNSVNDALLLGRPIAPDEARQIVAFLISRQNAGRCYRGMFAPMQRDVDEGYRLFTGEHFSKTANGAAGHVLGEEACRVLRILGSDDRCAVEAAERAFTEVGDTVRHEGIGWYCCARCSVALWRHLATVPTDEAANWLGSGVAMLKALRNGEGRWRRTLFYYTVLALTEMPRSIAKEELQYVAPTCDRLLARPSSGPYSERRTVILQRALALA